MLGATFAEKGLRVLVDTKVLLPQRRLRVSWTTLGLFSLEKRRLREDPIKVYKTKKC